MRPGDQIVTFGSTPSGRPYVPGVPIGRVISVPATPGALTQTALIAPYVDFTALDLVGVVVVPPRVNPRDRVLPTPPADATPTPRRH
jgi:rod shape-determining protein MreC